MHKLSRCLLLVLAATFGGWSAYQILDFGAAVEPDKNMPLYAFVILALILSLPLWIPALIPKRFTKTLTIVRRLSAFILIAPTFVVGGELENNLLRIFSKNWATWLPFFSEGLILTIICLTSIMILLWPEIKACGQIIRYPHRALSVRKIAIGTFLLVTLLGGSLYIAHVSALSDQAFHDLNPDHSLSGPRDEGQKAFYSYDWGTAFTLWKPLAEQGNADAQNNLGVLYERGKGVGQDYVQALKWFRKAAEKDNPQAEWAIGAIYANGWGIQADPIEAEEWFRKSASHSGSGFEGSLANVYDQGFKGIKKNKTEALKWYKISLDHGNYWEESSIARIYERDQNYEEAIKWWKSAASHQDTNAQMTLGDYYENGKGVKQDWAGAYYWYNVGVNNGALDGMRDDELQGFWDSLSIQKHLTNEQIVAIKKHAGDWKPASMQSASKR